MGAPLGTSVLALGALASLGYLRVSGSSPHHKSRSVAAIPSVIKLDDDDEAAGCPAETYCCPGGKVCLKPTEKSCKDDENACDDGTMCCPLTKLCVVNTKQTCTPACDGSYCDPKGRTCTTVEHPGDICNPDDDEPCGPEDIAK